MAVGLDRHAAVGVGPEDARADGSQSIQCLARGVPVGIAGASADDRDARLEGREEGLGRRGPAAMMGDFEQVEPATIRDTGGQQLRIDGFLDVACEQQAACAEVHIQDGRDVVDARTGVGRLERDLPSDRPADVDRGAVQLEVIAGSQPASLEREAIESLVEGGVAGARAARADLGHRADAVALQEQRQAGDMILVRVGEHHEIESSVPRRQSFIEDDEESIGIGAAVDQHAAAGVPLDQDGIALSDVEDRHPQASIRPGRTRQGGAADEDGQGQEPCAPGP